MKIIRNKVLPPVGFNAINLFGIVFTRKKDLSEKTLRHEAIHTAQMHETGFIFFYLWYSIEWLVRFAQYRDSKKAYRNISFEREAIANDKNENYLKRRKYYSFLKYIFKCQTV